MASCKIVSNGTLVRVEEKGQSWEGFVSGLCVDMNVPEAPVYTFGLVDTQGRPFSGCENKFWCLSDIKEILANDDFPPAYPTQGRTDDITAMTAKWVLGTCSTGELLHLLAHEIRLREEKELP